MPIDIAATILMMGFAGLGLATALIWRPAGYRAWAAVNSLVLGVALVALHLGLTWSALPTAIVYVPLVAVPQLLGRFVQSAAVRGRFGQAAAAVRVLGFVHPWSAASVTRRIYAALAETRVAASVAALERARSEVAPDYRAYIDVQIAAARGDWEGVRAIAADAQADGLALITLRAHGEVGDVPAMLRVLQASETKLVGSERAFAQLFTLALTGRPRPVAHLLATRLASIPEESKVYWHAVARLRADPADPAARAALSELAASAPREQTRLAAARHLHRLDTAPPPVADALSTRLLEAVTRDVEAPEATQPTLLGSPVTLALMALNALVFAVDAMFGTSGRLGAAIQHGALWEAAVTDEGEWWRLITAAFVHLGVLHLAFNLVALDALGRPIEAALGRIGMLATYLGLAVASNTLVYLLIREDWLDPHFLVGASGAIMGLLGIIVVWAAMRWVRTRRVDDSRRLLLLCFVVGLQALIDATVPQISAAAHISGFLCGVVVGLGLVALGHPRETAT